jgi:hypothetical protein
MLGYYHADAHSAGAELHPAGRRVADKILDKCPHAFVLMVRHRGPVHAPARPPAARAGARAAAHALGASGRLGTSGALDRPSGSDAPLPPRCRSWTTASWASSCARASPAQWRCARPPAGAAARPALPCPALPACGAATAGGDGAAAPTAQPSEACTAPAGRVAADRLPPPTPAPLLPRSWRSKRSTARSAGGGSTQRARAPGWPSSRAAWRSCGTRSRRCSKGRPTRCWPTLTTTWTTSASEGRAAAREHAGRLAGCLALPACLPRPS